MNTTPQSERKHIVFAGRRNAGKSSLVNAFIGQDLCIVSDTPGTTTDPVRKSMELLPFGPVVLVDTAGIDDTGELGEKRISKSIKAISSADFAIVVLDAAMNCLSEEEKQLIGRLEKLSTPFLIAVNKSETGINDKLMQELKGVKDRVLMVSCMGNRGIKELKEMTARLIPAEKEPPLISDLLKPGDLVVLVVPIDPGAPKGRLILPQVQTIREALDGDTIVVVTKDRELSSALQKLKEPPRLVVTDSQAIMHVSGVVPEDVSLTTFSILMARHKGDLPVFVEGLRRVEELKDGDRVLIAEACSHHAQEDDIGRVKIPRWIRMHTKKELTIEVRSGADFPENLSDYRLIIHCGGCMMTRHQMQVRLNEARLMEVPVVNYGVLISYMHGAVPRALMPFKDAMQRWSEVQGPRSDVQGPKFDVQGPGSRH